MNNNRFTVKPLALLAVPFLLTACMSTPSDERSAAKATEYKQAWYCDNLQVETSLNGENMELYVRDRSIPLALTVSASGSKYESSTKPHTVFWQKAEEAYFELDGQRMPTCYVAGHVPMPLTAQGNEPGWQVQLTNSHLTFTQMNGVNESSLPYTAGERTALRQRFMAKGAQGNMELMLTNQVCSDTMTGMPYPYTGQLKYDNKELKGCAGSPQQVLRGSEWYVQEVNGKSVGAELIRFSFLPEGRIAGYAGCNNFFGEYELTGEGIKFGQFGATRMACDVERMDLENAVFSIFRDASTIAIDSVGSLTIQTGDGHIRAIAL